MTLQNLSPDEWAAMQEAVDELAEYAREWDYEATVMRNDAYAREWDAAAAAAAQRAAVEQPPARRPRRTRNLTTVILVLCLVALAALWPTESHAHALYAQGRPACSVVQHTTLVLDGRYGAVQCPEGALTVALPSGVAPVNGPARVQLVARQRVVTYRLVDASRNVYPIVQE